MKLQPTARVALPLAFALGLALPARPSGGPDTPAQTASETDPHAKELRRVLTLHGGGFVRAKSRRVGEQWEYLDGSTWRTLSGERVVEVALERELLAQAKRLALEAGSDASRRAVYASWLCNAGLISEGVEELDQVLALEPDSPPALATCVELADFVRVATADARTEAGLTEWLRAGAASGPALREVALHQLGERVDPDVLGARLARELGADSSRTRAFAALGLRRLEPGKELVALVSRAVLDGSDEVRRQAALALKTAEEPAVVNPIVRALGSRHPAVRANAVEALGRTGYPSAVEPLIGYLAALSSAQGGGGWRPPAASIFVGKQTAYVQDYDVEVAQFAAVADPQVNVLTEGAVLDVRVISAYSINQVAEARRVRQALQRLTQADPGESAVAWKAWWDANRARFDPATPRTGDGS